MSRTSPAKYEDLRVANATLDQTEDQVEELQRELALSRESEASLHQQLTLTEVARDASREAYDKAIADLEALRQSAQEASAFYTRRISEEVDPLKHKLREETARRESAEAALREYTGPDTRNTRIAESHFARFGGQHD